jgi:hypothetical protein
VLLAGAAAWLDPRIGLALALATPLFPIGNIAAGAAIVYGIFAVGWIVLTWRDARHGLWFASGPLLAGVGLLPLVPLVLMPVRNVVVRAAQGVVAVLATALLVGTGTLELGRLDSATSTALGLWGWLGTEALVTVTAIVVAFAAAALPWARRHSRFGAGGVGFAVTAWFVLAGAGVAATAVVVVVWAAYALAAAAAHRA